MYQSYSFSNTMKPKKDRFRIGYVSYTSSSTYDDWSKRLDGPSAQLWQKLQTRFGEDLQLAMLLGATVIGISDTDLDRVFRSIYEETSPFDALSMTISSGGRTFDFMFFADKLAKETYYDVHYPCLCPEWLFAYGYSQQRYMTDLSLYWDGIPSDYYIPWETTRLGQDSPELARLKRLSQQARSEIDAVARHSSKRLSH